MRLETLEHRLELLGSDGLAATLGGELGGEGCLGELEGRGEMQAAENGVGGEHISPYVGCA